MLTASGKFREYPPPLASSAAIYISAAPGKLQRKIRIIHALPPKWDNPTPAPSIQSHMNAKTILLPAALFLALTTTGIACAQSQDAAPTAPAPTTPQQEKAQLKANEQQAKENEKAAKAQAKAAKAEAKSAKAQQKSITAQQKAAQTSADQHATPAPQPMQ
jgi:uncharacterized protein HemX